MRCHGSYSIKISDPIKFFVEAVPRNATRFDAASMNAQYTEEFLQDNSLQSHKKKLNLKDP